MAQTVIIEQGNRQLQDVTKTKPDTRVNQQAAIKYPATDLVFGMAEETFLDADETEFINPDAYVNPDAESDGGSDETEPAEDDDEDDADPAIS